MSRAGSKAGGNLYWSTNRVKGALLLTHLMSRVGSKAGGNPYWSTVMFTVLHSASASK
jgi:hypothetical protein